MNEITQIIAEMLPVASKFHGSDFEEILDKTFGPAYNELETMVEELYNSYFINLANGKDLDRLGKLYNVIRGDDEEDDDYRDRIIFQADQFCNRSNLEDVYLIATESKIALSIKISLVVSSTSVFSPPITPAIHTGFVPSVITISFGISSLV